ncbi:DUF2809 domain-containing protein [Citricoccus parietis]|uniref:DUF2809 domain-containing protein n=1 Tax=Citricoccus parietis TaxID=592307 RepID=A0ABV5G747_9MICC
MESTPAATRRSTNPMKAGSSTSSWRRGVRGKALSPVIMVVLLGGGSPPEWHTVQQRDSCLHSTGARTTSRKAAAISEPTQAVPARTRCLLLGAAVPVTIALGLGIRALSTAAWTGPAGDTLYAVLIYLLVAILLPARPRVLAAGLALTVCLAVELLQLTGLSAELGALWAPLRLVLGTTFGFADLVAYAGGVALAYAADRLFGVGFSRAARTP